MGALILAPFAVVACSSSTDDTGSTPPGTDAATATPTPEAGAVAETGTPDAGGADTSTTVDSGKCNDVPNGAGVIAEVAGVGTKPTPAGGTIADGTYHLTKHEVFSPATPDGNTRKRTIVFQGNTVRTHDNDTGQKEAQLAGTYTTSGAAITFTITCPVSATVTIPYTATATTFATFSQSDDIFTSTKQ
jgi:hypothetical protein